SLLLDHRASLRPASPALDYPEVRIRREPQLELLQKGILLLELRSLHAQAGGMSTQGLEIEPSGPTRTAQLDGPHERMAALVHHPELGGARGGRREVARRAE